MGQPNEVPGNVKALIREYLEYNNDLECVVWRKPPSPNIQAGDAIRDSLVSVTIGGEKLWWHRVVWFLAFGEFPASGIIHRDGDDRNNRLENLTLYEAKATPPQRAKIIEQEITARRERLAMSLTELGRFADRGIGVADDARKAAAPQRFTPHQNDESVRFRVRLWDLASYQKDAG